MWIIIRFFILTINHLSGESVVYKFTLRIYNAKIILLIEWCTKMRSTKGNFSYLCCSFFFLFTFLHNMKSSVGTKMCETSCDLDLSSSSHRYSIVRNRICNNMCVLIFRSLCSYNVYAGSLRHSMHFLSLSLYPLPLSLAPLMPAGTLTTARL